MAYGYLVAGTYESGFILLEDEQDHSPYDAGRNIVHAIMAGRATEAGHGRLVTFSLIPDAPDDGREAFEIDWRPLWDTENPRPIYFREMTRTASVDGSGDTGPVCGTHNFGYQYLDSNGENVQEIQVITPEGKILTDLTG